MTRGEIPNEIRDSWFARKTNSVVFIFTPIVVQYQSHPELEIHLISDNNKSEYE